MAFICRIALIFSTSLLILACSVQSPIGLGPNLIKEVTEQGKHPCSSECEPKSQRFSQIKNPKWQPDWTVFAQQQLAKDAEFLGLIPEDLMRVCPSLKNFTFEEKANFVSYTLFAIALAESALNPTTRYRETTMGRDPVTGEQIVSEGLFQVSYQERLYYGCSFDWSVDRTLDPLDNRKTIFNPFNQIDCAVRILKKQLQLVRSFFTPESFYWQVLKPGTRGYQTITNLIRENSVCKN